MNFLEPECAIVPKFSIISALVIPIPESEIVKIRRASSKSNFIYKLSYEDESAFYDAMNLYFSNASEALLSNSLINTSLSVYNDLATISSNFFVSALKSKRSVEN
jgi:hypothetical protein